MPFHYDNQKPGAQLKVFPPAAFVLALGASITLDYVCPSPSLTSAMVCAHVLGSALCAAALGMAGWAFFSFKKSGSDPHPGRPVKALVSCGPYRFSRNPMYVGLVMLLAGIAVLTTNLWGLAAAISLALLLHYAAILPEERYLRQRFGLAFEEYCKATRRWI